MQLFISVFMAGILGSALKPSDTTFNGGFKLDDSFTGFNLGGIVAPGPSAQQNLPNQPSNQSQQPQIKTDGLAQFDVAFFNKLENKQ